MLAPGIISQLGGSIEMCNASKDHNETLELLKRELARLKSKFKLGQELRLEWAPNNRPRSREVAGTTIRIHESDKAKEVGSPNH